MQRRRALMLIGLALPLAGVARPLAAQGLLRQGPIAALVPFATAPFPYHGAVPGTGAPFLDVDQDGREGHSSPRGGVYWADSNYSDNTVLVMLTRGFRIDRPAVMIVYFHGNGATLAADVINRQRVVDQVEAAGVNAVLVAPQFAVNALDSSAGKFWQPGAFAQFLEEAARHLAQLYGKAGATRAFSRLPIVLIAYSGGYNPAAYALTVGGAAARVRGVVLLDAAFGEPDRFATFIAAARRNAFFLSAYTDASEAGNEMIRNSLRARGIGSSSDLPDRLGPGYVGFVASPGNHGDFVTDAWVDDPVTWVMTHMTFAHR